MNKPQPLQAFELSLEIYLLIHKSPEIAFTAKEIRRIFFQHTKQNIRIDRIKQILNSMESRGRCVSEMRYNPHKNAKFKVYSAKPDTVSLDSDLMEISFIIHDLRKAAS